MARARMFHLLSPSFLSLLSAFRFPLSSRPSYAVFLQNTPILSDAVPRVGTLGWYALPRWGKSNDDVSHPAFMPSPGIPFHWAGMRCSVRANRTMTFRSRVSRIHATPLIPSGERGPSRLIQPTVRLILSSSALRRFLSVWRFQRPWPRQCVP